MKMKWIWESIWANSAYSFEEFITRVRVNQPDVIHALVKSGKKETVRFRAIGGKLGGSPLIHNYTPRGRNALEIATEAHQMLEELRGELPASPYHVPSHLCTLRLIGVGEKERNAIELNDYRLSQSEI